MIIPLYNYRKKHMNNYNKLDNIWLAYITSIQASCIWKCSVT